MDYDPLQKEAERYRFVRTGVTHVLHIVGVLLGILAVIFVAERLYRYSSQIDGTHISSVGWWLLAIFSVIYGAANIFLAIAWQQVLMFFGVDGHPRSAIRIYGVSQLARYVPYDNDE